MKDLTGQKFGRLTVTKQIGKSKNGKYLWLCLCDCGKETVVSGSDLVTNHTKSCGCFKKEFAGKQNLKHGHKRKHKESTTYKSWSAMLSRCNNKNNKDYKNYGGRGIKVCDKWNKSKGGSFENFLIDMGECPPGLTLDRIDNNKLINGYSPENCRWATDKQQCRNQKSNRILEYNDKKQCASEMAEEYNIPYKIFHARIQRGWPIKKALTTSVRYRRKNIGI